MRRTISRDSERSRARSTSWQPRYRARSTRDSRITFSAEATTKRSNSWNNCSGACVKRLNQKVLGTKHLCKFLTRSSSATAGGNELCFPFVLHNSFFSLSAFRPAVGCIAWLGALGGAYTAATNEKIQRGKQNQSDKWQREHKKQLGIVMIKVTRVARVRRQHLQQGRNNKHEHNQQE